MDRKQIYWWLNGMIFSRQMWASVLPSQIKKLQSIAYEVFVFAKKHTCICRDTPSTIFQCCCPVCHIHCNLLHKQ
jgi:hypothetical protein